MSSKTKYLVEWERALGCSGPSSQNRPQKRETVSKSSGYMQSWEQGRVKDV